MYEQHSTLDDTQTRYESVFSDTSRGDSQRDSVSGHTFVVVWIFRRLAADALSYNWIAMRCVVDTYHVYPPF